MESVESIAELPEDLTDIPIVFYIDEGNTSIFRTMLSSMLNRCDVMKEQLFFLVDSTPDSKQMVRTVEDLGVKEPELVASLDYESIRRYCANAPISVYVREVVVVLRSEVIRISKVLHQQNEQVKIQNTAVHETVEKGVW